MKVFFMASDSGLFQLLLQLLGEPLDDNRVVELLHKSLR